MLLLAMQANFVNQSNKRGAADFGVLGALQWLLVTADHER